MCGFITKQCLVLSQLPCQAQCSLDHKIHKLNGSTYPKLFYDKHKTALHQDIKEKQTQANTDRAQCGLQDIQQEWQEVKGQASHGDILAYAGAHVSQQTVQQVGHLGQHLLHLQHQYLMQSTAMNKF